jgi:hypothetical protein
MAAHRFSAAFGSRGLQERQAPLVIFRLVVSMTQEREVRRDPSFPHALTVGSCYRAARRYDASNGDLKQILCFWPLINFMHIFPIRPRPCEYDSRPKDDCCPKLKQMDYFELLMNPPHLSSM